jgi:hypothetical protein
VFLLVDKLKKALICQFLVQSMPLNLGLLSKLLFLAAMGLRKSKAKQRSCKPVNSQSTKSFM